MGLPVQNQTSITMGHLDAYGIPQMGTPIPRNCLTVFVEKVPILVNNDKVLIVPHANQIGSLGEPQAIQPHIFSLRQIQKNNQCGQKIAKISDGCNEDPIHLVITQQFTVTTL